MRRGPHSAKMQITLECAGLRTGSPQAEAHTKSNQIYSMNQTLETEVEMKLLTQDNGDPAAP